MSSTETQARVGEQSRRGLVNHYAMAGYSWPRRDPCKEEARREAVLAAHNHNRTFGMTNKLYGVVPPKQPVQATRLRTAHD
jgi:hypothetical protein